ncbi:MAG: hydroxyacylglutathione hydrolase [Alphaproteobacteria bacterium]
MRIETIWCSKGFMDNLSYIVIDDKTNTAAVIDPADASLIIKRCKELNIELQYILNTHHHYDHTDGNLELKAHFNAKVVAANKDAHRIPGFDIGVDDGDVFELGSLKADIIDVSAHTQGHILWYFKDEKALFTGDTLFNLCVGGLFEGTPQEMRKALDKIKKLPDDIMFYAGHEYTMHGADDAVRINKNSKEIQEYLKNAQSRLSQNLPVCPILLGLEKKVNPYLR